MLQQAQKGFGPLDVAKLGLFEEVERPVEVDSLSFFRRGRASAARRSHRRDVEVRAPRARPERTPPSLA